MDLGIGLIAGIIALPFSLIIALIIKATSPGPVFYGHVRIGRGGKKFKLLKVRSMVVDADRRVDELLAAHPEYRKEWEENRKIKDDPRITSFGKFLRKTSLDELPQIVNVLRGEMSLVGPRPVTDEERVNYGDDFDRIFSVRPGISGLWQVSGRSQTSYTERITFDSYYMQSWSIWLDLWVLYKTIGVVLRGKGAW
jgi:Undecaprenyl-phosphate galactose phosphotransferase WbaP